MEIRPDALGLVGLVRSLDFNLRAIGGYWSVLSENVKPSVLCFKRSL